VLCRVVFVLVAAGERKRLLPERGLRPEGERFPKDLLEASGLLDMNLSRY